MPTPRELEDKFWDALKSDRTVMLGLDVGEGGHARPMTAQFEEARGPIWFFTTRDNALVGQLDQGVAAHASFVAKDHDLFASIGGELRLDTDRTMVDRLWNPFVATWYDGGKDDPSLALLRFDADHAEIWENTSSLLTGLKVLFGADPRREAGDKAARVDLH
ncbi:MAG: pyridoxamine 5'-phosphate oxidase family protein [Lysobacter sp.]|nr:pyridoxamine 5'-phosphate oxidase family protein [Lysobacter sp.]